MSNQRPATDDASCPTGGAASLAGGDVHVWTVAPDELTDPELLASYEALMNAEERERRARFRFERGRHECLVTRALVRTTLSRYADVRPERWSFVVNAHGAPSLAPGQCAAPLRFNLAHTRGLIACAVTLEHDVGVDVEWLDRGGETVALADSYFSPSEVRDLHALPEERRHERFFQYWTLKESYIKARGMGLAVPLDQFSFHLEQGSPIRISFDERLGDDAAAWQFAQHEPSPRHRLAVSVRRGARADLAIAVESTVPLV